jgi:hypothetical protein
MKAMGLPEGTMPRAGQRFIKNILDKEYPE